MVGMASRRVKRVVASVGAAVIASTGLAACGSGDSGSGPPVINLYGFAAAAGFDKVIAQKEAALKDTLQPTIDTAVWKDKLYAIPKHTNVQLLWYRKSLVPKEPKTWDDVLAASKKLKAAGKPYVIGLTGAQYEGYVVGFNTILSSVGGTLVNEDSTKVTVDDKTVKALDIVKNLADSGLASKSLSNSQEPEVFASLQNEEAAFIMNWPYVLSAMKEANPEIAKDLAFTTLPEFEPGTPARATVGGMNWAISSYSKHPQETYDAAMCLRDPEAQLDVAIDSGEPPVNPKVYENPEFQKVYPMYQDMLETLDTAVPRPVTPLYQNVSTIVSSTLSPPSSISPEATAKELEDKIQQALDGKGILP
jgi:multiple sugar transport system substrate-binding protein